MKIFIWTIAVILGFMVALLGLVYFLPGYDMYIVRSDSMKPVFSAGDMVITAAPGRPLSGTIQPGSIVTFSIDGARITHRVASINGNNLITKGDANQDPDSRPVGISSVSGIYLFKIPFIGYLNAFVRTKLGWFLVIILPTVLLIGLIARDIIKEAFDIGKHKRTAGDNKYPDSQPGDIQLKDPKSTYVISDEK